MKEILASTNEIIDRINLQLRELISNLSQIYRLIWLNRFTSEKMSQKPINQSNPIFDIYFEVKKLYEIDKLIILLQI
jgi:hypothetical protein